MEKLQNSPIELREYQKECVARLNESSGTSLVQLPTGTGKSLTFAAYAADKQDVLILVPKVNLVMQTVGALGAFTSDVGVVCGTLQRKEADRNIVVCTIQSIRSLGSRKFQIVICDEAHRISPDSQYERIFYETPRRIGFTATPYRNGRLIYGPNELFPELTYEKDLNWSTAHNYTVRAITIEPLNAANLIDLGGIKTKAGDWDLSQLSNRIEADEKKLKRQVLDALAHSRSRNHILWVCVSQKHADMVHALLEQVGEPALIIHSNSDDEVDDIDADTRHIVSVMMFSEGVDIPRIDCVVLMRPTKSPTLMVQVVGRALRPFHGKNTALILDYGLVFKNCGPLNYPKLTEDKRETVGGYLEKSKIRCWQCQECGAMCTVGLADPRICTECGTEEKQIIQDKYLRNRADINAQLYKDSEKKAKNKEVGREWVVIRAITFAPSPDESGRRYKDIFLHVVDDPKQLHFRVHNPRYIYKESNRAHYYASRDEENKLEKFMRDALGDKTFDIANPVHRTYDMTPCEVQVMRKDMTRQYDKYYAHRVIEKGLEPCLFEWSGPGDRS